MSEERFVLLNRLILAVHLRSYDGHDLKSHLRFEESIPDRADEILPCPLFKSRGTILVL